jgi:cytochrome c peroxidase
MIKCGTRTVATSVSTAVVLVAAIGQTIKAETGPTESKLRRPVALVFDEPHSRLLVANSRSSTVSIIDGETLEVVDEQPICARIADFVALPGGDAWFALDSEANRLLLVNELDGRFHVAADVALPQSPVRVVVNDAGSLACVSCVWPHSVTLVAVNAEESRIEVRKTIGLPFPPREILLFDDDRRLLAGGAFRGELAVVNLELQWVESLREIRGHNIRGLALSSDASDVYVTHQQLHRLAQADFDDVHWGNLLTNGLRVVPVEALLDPDADLNKAGRLRSIGTVSDAAGDPGRVLETPHQTIVALAGVSEVAIGHPETGFDRLDVGLLPGALAVDSGRQRLFVANALDDTISVVDLRPGVREQTIRLGPAPELTAAGRGERLFFNARLSHDRWMSCNTCHSEGHTVDLPVDTLGDGDYGAPKRIPSLLGVGETAPYAWNGSLATLEQQIQKSVTTTMHGRELADDEVASLTAFLRTLQPPPAAEHPDAAAIERGREFFEKSRCARCHIPPVYTSEGTFDVGLSDERNRSEFNPPSLRGVSQRTRFFHDGRAESLEDVFRIHQHQLEKPPTDEQLTDLIAFLRSL